MTQAHYISRSIKTDRGGLRCVLVARRLFLLLRRVYSFAVLRWLSMALVALPIAIAGKRFTIVDNLKSVVKINCVPPERHYVLAQSCV